MACRSLDIARDIARMTTGTTADLAHAQSDRARLRLAREIFILLLGRMERLNREWASRTIARTPSLRGETAASVREDLLQELTLHLWSEMALGNDEAWEIFFTRALSFAQRHVATAFMERSGYWTASNVRKPSRGTAISFSRLTAHFEDDERSGDEWPQLAAPEDGMVAAELCDLRELVARLPKRQRAVVIMRYWQDAQERDIAASLGVTPRAVHAMLARAYAKLRAAYKRADPLVR
jgi:RNA polymerase sigma factor (sigma-70 family)